MRRPPGPPAEVSWAVPGPRLLSDSEVRAVVSAALDHGRRPELHLAVVFVSDAELARLHHETLGDPSPTDVLAFDLGSPSSADGEVGPAGEVYVSVERARAEARSRGIAPEGELALYIVHGCLHLCGHDDRRPEARARMRSAERAVLARLGYA